MRIRKPRLLAAITLALSLSVLGAGPASATNAYIFGVGAGSINSPTGVKMTKFAFSAHAGPQGDGGSLRWTIEDPNAPLDVHVDIDCVNLTHTVSPPGAGGFIGGTVTRVTGAAGHYGVSQGDGQVFGINDFGDASGPTPDEFSPYSGRDLPDTFCRGLGPMPQAPISQGNININLIDLS
jgi:hypothetical protein